MGTAIIKINSDILEKVIEKTGVKKKDDAVKYALLRYVQSEQGINQEPKKGFDFGPITKRLSTEFKIKNSENKSAKELIQEAIDEDLSK